MIEFSGYFFRSREKVLCAPAEVKYRHHFSSSALSYFFRTIILLERSQKSIATATAEANQACAVLSSAQRRRFMPLTSIRVLDVPNPQQRTFNSITYE
jgi:hypothetical protein